MSDLENFLKFERVGESYAGQSILTYTTKPTTTGLNWLAAPSSSICVGLAFRYNHNQLEALRLDGNEGISVLYSIRVPADVVHLACSPDGRLVAACLCDGSLHCYNATDSSFSLRWKIEGAHSHSVDNLSDSVSKLRNNGAGAAGPCRSLRFSPVGFTLLLVDSGRGCLTLYNADEKQPTERVQNQLSHIHVSCAAWAPVNNGLDCTISIGTSDNNGSIYLYKYNSGTAKLAYLNSISYPGIIEDDNEVGWTCTHIEWNETHLSFAAGYCRVTPNDENDDNDDENDSADHEAHMYMFELNEKDYILKSGSDLGDVVSFFAIPRHGRHAFFTASVNTRLHQPEAPYLMMISANVGTDVEVVGNEDGTNWTILDFPEGSKISTPTDEDYEYFYPTGLVCIYGPKSPNMAAPYVLLASTDGSLSVMRLVHGNDDSFLDISAINLIAQLPKEPVPTSKKLLTSEPELEAETQGKSVSDSHFDLTSEPVSLSFAPPSLNIVESQSSAFGSETFENRMNNLNTPNASLTTSDQPLFGQTASIFGSSATKTSVPSSGFGGGTTLFGSGTNPPVFGSGTTAPIFGTASSASVFGSSAPALVFGSGTSPTVFGSGSSNPFGAIAALGKSNEHSPFGLALNDNMFIKPKEASTSFLAATTSLTNLSTGEALGERRKDAESESDDSSRKPETKQGDFTYDGSNQKAMIAISAFDALDEEKCEKIPVSRIEELLDEVGEGFHGDELDVQISSIDPENSGLITKASFVSWYIRLVGGDEDSSSHSEDSIDSEERKEREEERVNALKRFLPLARNESDNSFVTFENSPNFFTSMDTKEQDRIYISVEDFPKLIESLNTTYCEEEHRKTVQRLSKDKKIFLNDFLDWYIAWLFGGDEGSSSDDDAESNQKDNFKDQSSIQSGWGNLFKKQDGIWKCDVCMVENTPDKVACSACETPRDGKTVSKTTQNSSTIGSVDAKPLIGAGGFSFPVSSDSKIGQSGFSFGGIVSSQPAAQGGVGGFFFNSNLDKKESTGFSFGTGTQVLPQEKTVLRGADPSSSAAATSVSNGTNLLVSNLKSDVASRAFDHFDFRSKGFLPISQLEDLLDGVGEGFDGLELERQKMLLDPLKTGKISKTSFVAWYTKLISGNKFFDANEITDREIAKQKALKCFMALQKTQNGDIYVTVDDFPKLIESANISYSDNIHSNFAKTLSKDGKIFLPSFLDWYIDWVFSGNSTHIDREGKQLPEGTRRHEASSDTIVSSNQTCDSMITAKETEITPPLDIKETKVKTLLESSTRRFDSLVENSKTKIEHVAQMFDSLDIDQSGYLPVSHIEELLDLIGEGFHGEELTDQIKLIDPLTSGRIEKSRFVEWYIKISHGDEKKDEDGEASLDSEEKAEREEEREKARKAFARVSKGELNDPYIRIQDFPMLIESLDTTYCEEEHSKTIKRLADNDGNIFLQKFLVWYIDWLFGGDESSDDDNSEVEDGNSSGKIEVSTSGGWGSLFEKKEGTWKCTSCLVENDRDAISCASCSTVRVGSYPGTSSTVATQVKKSDFTSPTIGPGGFSFGSNSTSASATPGFSFGGNFVKSSQGFSQTGETGTSGFTGFSLPNAPDASTGLKPETTIFPATKPINSASPSATGFVVTSSMSSTGPVDLSQSKIIQQSKEHDPSHPSKTTITTGFSSFSNTGDTSLTSTFSKSSLSSTAFPPLGASSPNPFSSQNQSTKPPETSNAAFPPMSGKAPTPFSSLSKTEDTKPVSSTIGGAFPPMSGNAPTPFSSLSKTVDTKPTTGDTKPTTEGTKLVSSTIGAAFPPMSGKAPTPFSSLSKTEDAKPAKGDTKPVSSTIGAAFPPMSGKAPTPFSSLSRTEDTKPAKGITKALSSTIGAAFPPMSGKAPTPFISFSKIVDTNPVSATISAAFPPMSGKAPTPFGSQSNDESTTSGKDRSTLLSSNATFPIVATQSETHGSSCFPPTSSKAPSLFGSFSNAGDTSLTSAFSKSSFSSTAFPPLGASSPNPFSVQNESKKPPETSNASFPPMSGKAPTPFSSLSKTEDTKPVSATISAAFPPMSGKAPTSFGSQSKAESTTSGKDRSTLLSSNATFPIVATQSATQGSSGFPPTSSKAPSLFGSFSNAGDTALASAFSKSSLSSTTFPPLGASSPNPFSVQNESKKPPETSNASFPPMSGKAPTPFSSLSKTEDTKPAKGITKPVSSTIGAAFPPMSGKAPTPFGGIAKKEISNNGSNSLAFNQELPSTAPSSSLSPFTSASNKGFSSYPTVSQATASTINNAGFPPLSKNAPTPFKSSAQHTENDLVISECSKQYIDLVNKLNQTIAQLADRRSLSDDGAMKKEIERVQNVLNHILVKFSNILDQCENSKVMCSQLLGRKSEASRKVIESERLVARLMSSTRDKLVDIIMKQPLNNMADERRNELVDSAMTANRLLEAARARFYLIECLDTPDAELKILYALAETFKRVKAFSEDSLRIKSKHFGSLSRLDPSTRSRSSNVVVGKISKATIGSPNPSDFSQQAARNRLAYKWNTIGASFEALKNLPRSKFDVIHSEISSFDRHSRNSVQIEKRSSNVIDTKKETSKTTFSTPIKMVTRSGWDEPSNVDKVKLNQLSFSVPRELKETTVAIASRTALSHFGTTPEKIGAVMNPGELKTVSAIPFSTVQKGEGESRNRTENGSFPPTAGISIAPSKSLETEKRMKPQASLDSAPTIKPPKKVESFTIEQNREPVPLGTPFEGISSFMNNQNTSSIESGNSSKTQPVTKERPDYHAILTEFLKQHNPSKVSEGGKLLEKYKGREKEMFAKLAVKYKTKNPLKSYEDTMVVKDIGSITSSTGLTQPSSVNIADSLPSSFSANETNQNMSQPQTSTSYSFGAQSTNVSIQSPFLNSAQSIGAPAPPFGGMSMEPKTPFGNPNTGPSFSPAPFGQVLNTISSPSPFGSSVVGNQMDSSSTTTLPSQSTVGGSSARDMLLSFYQQYNPQKLAEVDKLLVKYSGNEEQMFRNLAKKYNMDPSVFGLSTAPATPGFGLGVSPAPAGFGQPSSLGGGLTFGNATGTPNTPSFGGGGASPFGSVGAPTPSGFGFGALAQSAGTPSSFGSFAPPPTTPFGSPSPFGSYRG